MNKIKLVNFFSLIHFFQKRKRNGKDAVKKNAPEKNPHEDGEVFTVTPDALLRYARNGTIEAMGQVASVYIGLDYLGFFKKRR